MVWSSPLGGDRLLEITQVRELEGLIIDAHLVVVVFVLFSFAHEFLQYPGPKEQSNSK